MFVILFSAGMLNNWYLLRQGRTTDPEAGSLIDDVTAIRRTLTGKDKLQFDDKTFGAFERQVFGECLSGFHRKSQECTSAKARLKSTIDSWNAR
jgi:hypothetical protein